ncbi:MAG: general secretion pathway protein GspB [Candidatus Thiodiazotropha sp. (ex Codakia orbicularis)]|nr:general secretion pathway protein GspB [Candidatus Thiodiazotropha sp. (ex Codakia orbicularis)]
MSLILEALKKAERQHKLGEVPKINPDAEQPTSTASHRLGWLMMVMLAMILLGTGIYLGSSSWWSQQPQQHGPSVSSTEPVPQGGVQERAPAELTLPDTEGMVGDSDPAISVNPPQAAIEPQPVIATPQAKEIELPQVVEPEPPQPPPPKPLYEMPSGFVANLPSMNIDIHSYDQRPAKRYVLINMEKYREGDYLAEGPRVLEILPQGAVMEHMGERFILPIGN